MGGPGRRSTELSLSSIVGQPTISTEFKVEPGQQDVACQAVQLCSREVIVKTTAAPPGCLTKVLGSSFPSQDVELRALLYYNLQPDGLDTLHLYAGFAKVSYRVKSAESAGFIIGCQPPVSLFR